MNTTITIITSGKEEKVIRSWELSTRTERDRMFIPRVGEYISALDIEETYKVKKVLYNYDLFSDNDVSPDVDEILVYVKKVTKS